MIEEKNTGSSSERSPREEEELGKDTEKTVRLEIPKQKTVDFANQMKRSWRKRGSSPASSSAD